MDKITLFLTVLHLVCLSTSFGSEFMEFYDGSGGSGDIDETTVPTTVSTVTPTVPTVTPTGSTGQTTTTGSTVTPTGSTGQTTPTVPTVTPTGSTGQTTTTGSTVTPTGSTGQTTPTVPTVTPTGSTGQTTTTGSTVTPTGSTVTPTGSTGQTTGSTVTITSSTVPSTTSITTTRPPNVDERVTMVLQGVTQSDFENELEEDFKESVSTYVQLYCSENTGECVPTRYLVKSVQVEVVDQPAIDDLFLSFEKKHSDKEVEKISETQQYQVMDQNVTVGPDDVIITSTTEEGENLNVIYYVNAVTSDGDILVVPQTTVESTLDTYEQNITEDLGGVEFDYIPDSEDGEGGDDGDDLEPWAIALISVGAVAVVGGAGYFVYKQQGKKKNKKRSQAYIDDYSRENINNSSNGNLYAKNQEQRTSYGSASASYKYDNPTYDNTEEKSSAYQDVDLESGSSGELRTSL